MYDDYCLKRSIASEYGTEPEYVSIGGYSYCDRCCCQTRTVTIRTTNLPVHFCLFCGKRYW